MLSAAGSLRWLRDVVGGDVRRAGRRGGRAWPAGDGGADVPALPRRASARRTPTRTRAASFSGLSLRHDRGALVRAVLEGVAYGLRDSLELLRELGVEPTVGARLRRRRAQRAVAEDRRLGARHPARAHGGRGGRGLRRGAARRGRARASSPTRTRRSPRACASATRSSPTPSGRASTTRATGASGPSIRHYDNWRDNELSKARSRSSPARAAASAPRSRGRSTRGRQARPRVAARRRPRPRATSPRARLRRQRPRGGGRAPRRDRRALRQLDIVVANAGVGAYGPFLDLKPEHLEEMIDVNLKGTLYAVRAALPHLLKSDGADIVTLASEAGRRGLPYEAVYCASKFGQVGFTRALDHELREQGVRCTNVCPGGVATEFALDDGPRPEAGGARRDDDRRGRRGDRHVRAHAAAQPPHPGDRDPPDDGDVLGLEV